MIKDRLIEVDLGEALALAGVGETVRCVGPETGLVDLEDALDGLTFFVYEGKLAARGKPEPIKMCMTPPRGAASYDTPESRTRALIESVERYDEEHEAERKETKQEALAKEYGGEEEPAPVPFAEAPTGGGVEMTSGKIKINGHNTKPTEAAKAPLTKADERRKLTIAWTDDMLGVLGAMRYALTADGQRTTKWSLDRLRTYFRGTYDDIVHGLELYRMDEMKYDKAAEKYILPDVRTGRAVWTSIKKKEEENAH